MQFLALDLKNGNNYVYEGDPKNNQKPSVTVTVDDDDFLKIVNGKLDGIKVNYIFLLTKLIIKE